jgi:hypothetical protein
MMPEAPPRRRRPRKALKTTIMILGIILALCCLGGTAAVAIVGYELHVEPRAEAQIRVLAEELTGHFEAGEYDAVYETLSAEARSRYGPEILAQRLADRPRPSGHHIDHISAFLWLSYFTINFYYPDGQEGTHTFDLVKEHNMWLVDSDLLRDLDTGPRHGGRGGGYHHYSRIIAILMKSSARAMARS